MLVALVTFAVAGCSDVPLMPKWDTEWSFPLVSRTSNNLFGTFTVTVNPGASFDLALPIQKIKLDDRLRSVLGQQISNLSLVITISKAMAVGGNYTLAVARDSAGLRGSQASRIALDFAITPASQSTTDSVVVSLAGLAMIQNVADLNGLLWVQLRGQTTYAGPGSLVIIPSDSIMVHVTLRATIAMSN